MAQKFKYYILTISLIAFLWIARGLVGPSPVPNLSVHKAPHNDLVRQRSNLTAVIARLEYLAQLTSVDSSQFPNGCIEIDIKFNGWIRQFDCHLVDEFQRYRGFGNFLTPFPFGGDASWDPRGNFGRGTAKQITTKGAHIPHALLPGPGNEMLQFYGWAIDLIAFEMFFSYPQPKRGGFYVEFGAEDGVKVSNTYFFEKYLGWKGLLIEPSVSCCKELLKFRNAFVENYAVCKKGNLTAMFSCDGTDQPPAECRLLQDLFDKHGIKHIDLLSIDVEGFELGAIQTIDWTRTTVDVIVMEWRPNDGDARQDYFRALGYSSFRAPVFEAKRIGMVTDEYFWHTDRVNPFVP